MKINYKLLFEKIRKSILNNILKFTGVLIALIAIIMYFFKLDTDFIVTILAFGGLIIMIDIKINKK